MRLGSMRRPEQRTPLGLVSIGMPDQVDKAAHRLTHYGRAVQVVGKRIERSNWRPDQNWIMSIFVTVT